MFYSFAITIKFPNTSHNSSVNSYLFSAKLPFTSSGLSLPILRALIARATSPVSPSIAPFLLIRVSCRQSADIIRLEVAESS